MIDYIAIAKRATGRFGWMSREQKEDMVGHIFLGFARYLAKRDAVDDPKMFTVIARRSAIDWWDKNKNYINRIGKSDCMDEYVIGDEDIKVSDFDNLIATLTPRKQEILRLYYRYNYNHYEIAKKFGITFQAVQQNHQRALLELRSLHGYEQIQS